VRYNVDGSLDPTFGSGGKVIQAVGLADQINALVLEPGGKLVAAGSVAIAGRSDFALVRYTSDGQLDPAFGAGGRVTIKVGSGYGGANALVIQPDGRLVAGGYTDTDGHFVLVRFAPGGRLDHTFGMSGTCEVGGAGAINALVRQSNGKLVAAGDTPKPNREESENGFPKKDFVLVRYTSDGRLDTTFGTGGRVTTPPGTTGNGQAYALVVQPDGRLVAAGCALDGRRSDFALVRYSGDAADLPRVSR
jgi:uncharacterized delta-60 repeat protein